MYVINYGSNSVSVIDLVTDEVVGVTFDIVPFEGGQIICNDLHAPNNRYFYVSSGTECIAKPNNGYKFASWVETFNYNSTRTISASSGSIWSPFLDFFNIKLDDPAAASPFISFLDFMNVTSDDLAATITVNRFGNFTAYFNALPPPEL